MSDDDWDTDPDFVNDVSEKQQRWGNKGSTVATRVTVLSLHLSFCLSWCASFSYIFYVRGCLCGFMCMCVSGMCVRARVYFFMRTCAHIRVCFNVCVCVCVFCVLQKRGKFRRKRRKQFWRLSDVANLFCCPARGIPAALAVSRARRNSHICVN